MQRNSKIWNNSPSGNLLQFANLKLWPIETSWFTYDFCLWFSMFFFVCFVYQRLWLQDWPPEAPGLWRVLPSFNPGRLPWPRKQPNGDRNEISAVAVFSKFTYFEIWLYKTCCRSYLRRIRWSLGLLSPELNTYLWVNTCNKVVSWDTSMCQDTEPTQMWASNQTT